MLRNTMPRLTYANVMSTIAVVGVLAGGSAWAAASAIGTSEIKDGAVTTQKLHATAVTSAKLAGNAVTSLKVADLSLGLHDLGGEGTYATAVLASPLTVPAGGCEVMNVGGEGAVGSLVVGFLTDAHGDAVLDNWAAIVPTMVSKSTQGGAQPSLLVCAAGGLPETVPTGSVFHYRMIAP